MLPKGIDLIDFKYHIYIFDGMTQPLKQVQKSLLISLLIATTVLNRRPWTDSLSQGYYQQDNCSEYWTHEEKVQYLYQVLFIKGPEENAVILRGPKENAVKQRDYHNSILHDFCTISIGKCTENLIMQLCKAFFLYILQQLWHSRMK